MPSRQKFPLRLFVLYGAFFAGQAVYDSYMSLHLSQSGFSQSQIGWAMSMATAFLLFAQPVWGRISDGATNKNNVLRVMYLCSALVAIGFYFANAPWLMAVLLVALFAFFSAAIPLNDDVIANISGNIGWDFGKVRMGGSIGYALVSAVIASFVGQNYRSAFLWFAACMLACFVVSLRVEPVAGGRSKKEKTSYKVLLQNKPLMGMILFNFLFWMGLNFFYSFYPLHFVAIGGTNVGWMMLACTCVEIPCMFIMGWLVKRFGVRNMMLAAGLITTLRWLGLAVITNPTLAILLNLTHGFCYAAITYCLVQYINTAVPESLRASSQSLNNLAGIIASRFVVGLVGGMASDAFGSPAVLYALSGMMLLASVGFALWSRTYKNELKISAE